MDGRASGGAAPPAWLSWGRLLRVSLFATAAADALAGFVLAQRPGAAVEGLGVLGPLVLISLGLYHGGMALNDWADREEDRRVGRDRPLPAGWIAPGAALLVALALIGGAVGGAFLLGARCGTGALALALMIVLYDLVGRGDLLGPALLAACRGLNLSLPLLALRDPSEIPAGTWSAPLLYGLYVFAVSRLGRYEDGAASPLPLESPARLARLLGGLLPLAALLPIPGVPPLGRGLALVLGLAGARGLLVAARGLSGWTPEAIPPVMGLALRRLLVVTGCLALLRPVPLGLAVAVLFVVLYRVAWRLRRHFPPS